jgi:hypothetical protein
MQELGTRRLPCDNCTVYSEGSPLNSGGSVEAGSPGPQQCGRLEYHIEHRVAVHARCYTDEATIQCKKDVTWPFSQRNNSYWA